MSLKEKVISGTKWVALANIFNQVMRIVSLVIFARLLSPDDFGIYSILMIFVNFLIIFVDMGTAAALIHIKKPTQKLLSSVFYFNIFIGIFLFLLLVLLSASIASFFEILILRELLIFIAINFIVMSFGVVQKAKLEKALDVKKLVLSESLAGLIGIVFGISAAVYGLGVYSLIIHVLTTSIATVVFIWMISRWRPSLYFSFEEIKKIWGYTANLTTFNFINYFSRNADSFLIGKFLGTYPLGVYSLAYSMMLYPIQNISRVLIRILFPAFSHIQEDNVKFKAVYLKTIFFIALISFPLMIGLVATSELFVKVVFGEKWENLAMILMLLAPIGMLKSIGETNGVIYMAKGNTRLLLKVGTFSTIVTVVFFIGGISFGVEGVAIGYLLSSILLVYPIYKISWNQIELTLYDGFKSILPIFLISSFMGICVWFAQQGLHYFALPNIMILIVSILLGILIYFGLIAVKYGSIKLLMKELRS